MQIGANNSVIVQPQGNLLRDTMYAAFPLIPTETTLFTPDAVADSGLAEYDRESQSPEKPWLIPGPIYNSNAEEAGAQVNADDPTRGSVGKITGSLSAPVVDIAYALKSNKSQVQLPGGLLSIRSARGNFHYDLGSALPPSLNAEGLATGTVDGYDVEGDIHGNILAAEGSQWITFRTVNAPPGAKPLTSDDISAQLFGVPNFLAMVQNKETLFSPVTVTTLGTNMYFNSWLRRLANGLSLDTLSLGFDANWAAQTSFTTPEFGVTPWTSFRVGATRNFTVPATWRAWLEYTIPGNKWLRNLSMTSETNDQQQSKLTLQYSLPFSTAGKAKKVKDSAGTTETKETKDAVPAK